MDSLITWEDSFHKNYVSYRSVVFNFCTLPSSKIGFTEAIFVSSENWILKRLLLMFLYWESILSTYDLRWNYTWTCSFFEFNYIKIFGFGILNFWFSLYLFFILPLLFFTFDITLGWKILIFCASIDWQPLSLYLKFWISCSIWCFRRTVVCYIY